MYKTFRLKQSPLPGISLNQPFFKHFQQLRVAHQAPGCLVHEAWRDFSCEAFDQQVRSQPLEEIHEEIDIAVQGECHEILPPFAVLPFHRGAFDDLQLVELD